MTLWMELLLTLLAAVGLLALGWVLFGKLVAPVGGKESPIYAVIPASGGGDGLEHTVRGLLWLQGGQLARCNCRIVDCGLDQRGRAAAAVLCEQGGVILCPMEQLADLLRPDSAPQAQQKDTDD